MGRSLRPGTVVSRDVAPYSVVGGIPARKLRMRFEDDQIERLERNRWWEHDIATLIEQLPPDGPPSDPAAFDTLPPPQGDA